MTLTKNNSQRGTAIVLVISILATLMVIVAVAFDYTMNIGRNVQRSNTLESAIAIADGCLDHNFAQWRQKCRNPAAPYPTTNQLSSLELPTQAQFPNVSNFAATRNDYSPGSTTTVQQCKVVALDPELKALTNDNTVPTKQTGVAPIGGVYNYLASAYVTLPALGGRVVAKVQRVFQEQQDSPFNYALFYVDPLEIHPGPSFNVTGWVHTNSDLYTAHNTLNFAQKATFSGDWSIGFRPGDTSHNGETPKAPTGVAPVFDSQHQPVNLDPTTFDPANPNNTGYHELIEPPVSGSADPFATSRYYDQAGVILEIDATNNVTIKRGNGDGTATVLTNKSKGNDKKLYNMFKDAITTNDSIQDNREQAVVRIATLDVSKITKTQANAVNKVQWYAGSVFNGTVYINDTSASADGTGAKRAIRIENGSIIPDQGLTVASPNPVYIQGDFNTGRGYDHNGDGKPDNGIDPPSNSGDPTKPEVSNYIRQPCSVIADAVNVLSNAWDDNKAGTVPTGSPTTVNTAIVSGNVTGGAGFVYTGGAENFPRFLENWSGKDFTYYGSMIELYQSKQSIGVWGKANVYSPPDRKWFFDSNFKLNPPPGAGAFLTYSYIKGRWSLAP